MAGVGAGHWANLDEACAAGIEVAQRIEPDPADLAAYKPATPSGASSIRR